MGLAGWGTGDPATPTGVDLYRFDQTTGGLITNAVGEGICAPCTFTMGGSAKAISPRKRKINIQSVILDGGGTVGDMVGVTAVLVASGNAQDVNMTAVTTLVVLCLRAPIRRGWRRPISPRSRRWLC
ncbi:hypothetical protein COW53_09230 [bacterium CG17_big_fil_post_rev_8_21_14_2_50_64_8]|nr:MAG: hypothetical protein COW53_09230 [bacterium CG17_big_fil_post_rev_8_21_14_2_50_64_8]PJA73749.1 MAG: hypothetical protein CO151_12610 [bacterium CG_4_9_14_3_um_filter_65_15]